LVSDRPCCGGHLRAGERLRRAGAGHLGAAGQGRAASVATHGIEAGGTAFSSAVRGDRPHMDKVLTVVEENHSLAEMQHSMPYLYSVANRYAYASDYTAVSHPSLPNYLAISGGSTFDVGDDVGPSAHPISGPSVFGQALAAGKIAKVFAESMPADCALSNSGSYAVRHTAWPYYVAERAACQAGQVPMGSPAAGALTSDIAAGALPNIGWAIPNLDHDAPRRHLGRGGPLAAGLAAVDSVRSRLRKRPACCRDHRRRGRPQQR
jgi:phosphatidylinositol-3-phosphatase